MALQIVNRLYFYFFHCQNLLLQPHLILREFLDWSISLHSAHFDVKSDVFSEPDAMINLIDKLSLQESKIDSQGLKGIFFIII